MKEGKVRHLGLSEAGAVTLERARAGAPHHRAPERVFAVDPRPRGRAFSPPAARLGIGFVAYSPLGRGFLTGQIRRFEDLAADDYRRTSPRFQGDNFQKNLDLVARVEALAKKKGCTPAQLALAWVLAQGADIVPIPGTKRRSVPRGERRRAPGGGDPGRSVDHRRDRPQGCRGGAPLPGAIHDFTRAVALVPCTRAPVPRGFGPPARRHAHPGVASPRPRRDPVGPAAFF